MQLEMRMQSAAFEQFKAETLLEREAMTFRLRTDLCDLGLALFHEYVAEPSVCGQMRLSSIETSVACWFCCCNPYLAQRSPQATVYKTERKGLNV